MLICRGNKMAYMHLLDNVRTEITRNSKFVYSSSPYDVFHSNNDNQSWDFFSLKVNGNGPVTGDENCKYHIHIWKKKLYILLQFEYCCFKIITFNQKDYHVPLVHDKLVDKSITRNRSVCLVDKNTANLKSDYDGYSKAWYGFVTNCESKCIGEPDYIDVNSFDDKNYDNLPSNTIENKVNEIKVDFDSLDKALSFYTDLDYIPR